MKSPLLFVLFCLLFANSFTTKAQVIGTLTSNGPVITYSDPGKIVSQWNEALKTYSNIDARLTSVKIVASGDGTYLLIGNGPVYQSSFLLSINTGTGNIFIPTTPIYTSCTTKACANNSGCEVKTFGGCTECPNGDCVKTTTNHLWFSL